MPFAFRKGLYNDIAINRVLTEEETAEILETFSEVNEDDVCCALSYIVLRYFQAQVLSICVWVPVCDETKLLDKFTKTRDKLEAWLKERGLIFTWANQPICLCRYSSECPDLVGMLSDDRNPEWCENYNVECDEDENIIGGDCSLDDEPCDLKKYRITED
jgi:hypothetical protein